MNKKALVVKFRPLVALACRMNNLFGLRLRRKGTNNQVSTGCVLGKKSRIRISGSNNRIIIGAFTQLRNTSIRISGSNNTVIIGPWCTIRDTDICIEDSGNSVTIGQRTRILGKTQLAAIEGTNITLGEDCLFSTDILLRTGDSHSILDLQGNRINPSEDIVLGEHVWVGTKVTCLKGTRIPDNSIVGACALVTRAFTEPNCVLAGVPAKVVRRGVNWNITRIPVASEPETIEK